MKKAIVIKSTPYAWRGGRALLVAARRAGYSQSDLSRALGVTRQSVWTWVHDVAAPRPSTAAVLLRVLGQHAGYVLEPIGQQR